MLSPEDAISEEEAFSALLQKLGLPAGFADQMAAKASEDLKLEDDTPDGTPKQVCLGDYVFMGEKIGGRYCISRKDLQVLLDKTQPDPDIVRARDAGEKFVLE
jgi:hypothetical protein